MSFGILSDVEGTGSALDIDSGINSVIGIGSASSSGVGIGSGICIGIGSGFGSGLWVSMSGISDGWNRCVHWFWKA